MAESDTSPESPTATSGEDATRDESARSQDDAGSQAEGRAAAEQVIDALFERQGGRRKVQDQRKSPRSPWVVQLELTLVGADGIAVRIKATTHDLSVGGFSFLYGQYVNSGTIVITSFKAMPDQPKILCVVCNCAHVDGTTHRVGVRFEKTSPNPERCDNTATSDDGNS